MIPKCKEIAIGIRGRMCQTGRETCALSLFVLRVVNESKIQTFEGRPYLLNFVAGHHDNFGNLRGEERLSDQPDDRAST